MRDLDGLDATILREVGIDLSKRQGLRSTAEYLARGYPHSRGVSVWKMALVGKRIHDMGDVEVINTIYDYLARLVESSRRGALAILAQ